MNVRIRGEAGVVAALRNIVRKKDGGRGASSRRFAPRIGFSMCVSVSVAFRKAKPDDNGVGFGRQ